MGNEMDVLEGDEVRQLVERYGERKGGERVNYIRIFLATDGLGSFSAGSCNTATGYSAIWLIPGSSVSLRAQQAPGWRFDYWDYNGNYMSSDPNHTCNPYGPGSTITAHFVPEE